MYGEVLEREYREPERFSAHRYTVDAFAVQHPGTPSPQSIQSVTLHLMSLCAVMKHGASPEDATKILQAAAKQLKPEFVWITPPPDRGCLTVFDLHEVETAAAHRAVARSWAQSVWEAWHSSHASVERWLQRLRA